VSQGEAILPSRWRAADFPPLLDVEQRLPGFLLP
jgi:hypothetical protein